jgi:hypothetical protein
MLELNQILSFF